MSVAGLAQAQTTLTLNAPGTEINVDTTIRGGGYASVNYGTSESLVSKQSGDSSYVRRILLKFDTQNLIPQGAVINSAKLYLVLKDADAGSTRPLAVFRVASSFLQREATWLDRRDSMAWSTRGGDLAEKYTTTYVGSSIGSTYTFDLTQLVQRTVRGDFGSRYTRLALVDTGSAGDAYRAFHSTRSANTALRPRLVISYGTGSSTTTSSSTSGTTLKVMQWNIHKTKGTDGVCNADRTANWIVKLGADVISLNEVSYFAGSCSYTADQGATLEALVEKKSGRTWYRKAVIMSKLSNVILSRYPFSSTASHQLSYDRGIVQASVVVNGRTINIFSTHVEYFNSTYRTTQTKEAKAWAANFASPRIVMGDFNTWPDTSDYDIIASAYGDGWMEAKQKGTATSYNGTGDTHGASRFDYVYRTKVTQLELKSVSVPDTRTNGAYPSDHDPVVAVFQVH